MYFAIKWPKAIASLALPGATDAGRRAGGNGDGARTGVEFEFTRFKLIQITLGFEEYDLAIRLAAGLKSNAQLSHRRVADELVMHIHMTLASCAADNKSPRAYRREYCIGVALVEKYSAFSRMLEKFDGLVVFAGGVSHAGSQDK